MSASQLSAAKSSRPAHRIRRTLSPSTTRVPIPLAYNVTVGDVMNRDPVTIGPEASLFDALILMRSRDISGLAVVEAGQYVVGVLSQKDLARSLGVAFSLPDTKGLLDVLLAGIRSDPEIFAMNFRRALQTTTVGSVMSRPPILVQVDAPLELAMEVMSENSISRLPVVDQNRLVGIVTPTDLVSAALRTHPGKPSKQS